MIITDFWHSLTKQKWNLTSSQLILFVSLVNIALYHLPLFTFINKNLNVLSLNGLLTVLSVIIVIFLFSYIFLLLIALVSSSLIKPFSILFALTSSIALYFTTTYHVILDKTMMGNMFNTQFSESSDYLHPKMIIYFIVFGLVPSLLMLKVNIKQTKRLRLIIHSVLVLLLSISFIVLNASSWLWIDKNAKQLGGAIMPWSYVLNSVRFQTEKAKANQIQELLPDASFSSNKKTVVILVIGETARAQNFSLYGYDKLTNPLLEKSGAIIVKNALSCSTYTTASVKCMITHRDSSKSLEPLPSYLQRHGIDVIWRTNNWGEPRVKVNTYKKGSELRKKCRGIGCEHDGVLLTGLKERIESSQQNKVFIVLHTNGSHGPSYYKKYPKEFLVFKPVCKTVELSECTSQALINAYDNSILYTDYFLNRTIDLLKTIKDRKTVFIYASDHGESLGEFGIYLHGTPYSFAPDVQKKIPFIIWGKDVQLKKRDHYSHKNIFHTIMGIFDMKSAVYKQELDILQHSSTTLHP